MKYKGEGTFWATIAWLWAVVLLVLGVLAKALGFGKK